VKVYIKIKTQCHKGLCSGVYKQILIKKFDELIEHVSETPEILECHAVLGEGSHILKVLVKGTEDLEKLLANIQAWPGVLRTVTSFVLSTIKETTNIKL